MGRTKDCANESGVAPAGWESNAKKPPARRCSWHAADSGLRTRHPVGFVTTVVSWSIAKMILAPEDASNRRSRAALVERPHGDAEFARLVGEVRGDPRAGESDDADRQHVEHLVVALERRRLGVLGPVGLEGDLRNLSMIGPFRCDALGALRRASVQQHHVGVFGADLVEPVPDGAMIVEVEPAGEGDFRSGGEQHLRLGATLGGDKVAAVDHGRGQRAMIDHRSAARTP